MGKIRKKAKGPNPLSVKKKQSYYIQKEKDLEYKKKMGLINDEKNYNIISLKENEGHDDDNKDKDDEHNNKNENQKINNSEATNNTFIKKKRKRRHKKSKNQFNE